MAPEESKSPRTAAFLSLSNPSTGVCQKVSARSALMRPRRRRERNPNLPGPVLGIVHSKALHMPVVFCPGYAGAWSRRGSARDVECHPLDSVVFTNGPPVVGAGRGQTGHLLVDPLVEWAGTSRWTL
jgi:hypothetical protein